MKLVGIKALIAHVRARRGQGYSVRKVHQLVATGGLPAYRDPDHLTAAGTPALLFDLEEFDRWYDARLVRVNPAPLPAAAPVPLRTQTRRTLRAAR